jgi:spore germination cell wall hydrolase CwlJ-like protein
VKLQRKVVPTILVIACVPLLRAGIPLTSGYETPAEAQVVGTGSYNTALAPVQITPMPERSPERAPRVSVSIPKYELTSLERHIVASCLVLEAASQGETGMRGVMAVIRNRARGLPELFAPTVLKAKQFSALNRLTAGRESMSRVVARAKRDRMWPVALKLVDEAVLDTWHDPTHGATHYTRVGERNAWTRTLARTVTIGRHAFYR